MTVDFKSLNNVLKHPMRRSIVLALSERESVSYVDLMNLVGARSTGKFNYHLKVLGDLIAKDQGGKYVLTEKGRLTVQFLEKFPEKQPQQAPLSMADAVLIGFVGCVLMLCNPGFWTPFLMAVYKVNVTLLLFNVFNWLIFLFALIVPGSVMWLLTVRRAHSHDSYDLFKPPFVAFILLLILLLVVFFTGFSFTITLTTPATVQGNESAVYLVGQLSLTTIFVLSLLLIFPSVFLAETVSKIRKKL